MAPTPQVVMNPLLIVAKGIYMLFCYLIAGMLFCTGLVLCLFICIVLPPIFVASIPVGSLVLNPEFGFILATVLMVAVMFISAGAAVLCSVVVMICCGLSLAPFAASFIFVPEALVPKFMKMVDEAGQEEEKKEEV